MLPDLFDSFLGPAPTTEVKEQSPKQHTELMRTIQSDARSESRPLSRLSRMLPTREVFVVSRRTTMSTVQLSSIVETERTPQNKAHEPAQYLSNSQEAGLEELLRDVELLNWNVSPPVIREIAYETRRMGKPGSTRPGLHWVCRFARRFRKTVTMGKGKLEAKERHAAKDPPTVIKFLENVSSHLLIV